MRIRLAKPSDSKAISEIHYRSRDRSSTGFFSQVSKLFLVHYYKVVLDDPNSVVVCAEDTDGTVCGFASATLDAEKQFTNLSKHKFRLGLALVPTIIMKPKMLREAVSRYLSTQGKGEESYVSITGVRGEYWVWDPCNSNTIWAGILNNAHLHMLQVLGAKNLNFEVDEDNLAVVSYSQRNGAELVDRKMLRDGRGRLMMNYDLVKKFGYKRS
ncbi:MAG: hypothetical protein P4K83_08635 [Terracidiphilus sp.]|nr:hypothetical protein [Terracidiphilus sp.]